MQKEVNKMSSNTGGNMNNYLNKTAAQNSWTQSDSEDDLGCDIDDGVAHNLI